MKNIYVHGLKLTTYAGLGAGLLYDFAYLSPFLLAGQSPPLTFRLLFPVAVFLFVFESLWLMWAIEIRQSGGKYDS